MTDVALVRFRYTLPAGVNKSNIDTEVLNQLVPVLRAKDCITIGYEEKRSDGMPTHPHIHIAFNTEDSLKNIRGRFRTWLKTCQDERIDGSKGAENKVYSLTNPKDGIENIRRHYRYCWKQGGRLRTHEKLGHLDGDEEDTEMEEERAKAEYASTSDALAKAKAKQEKKLENSTYTKIQKSCDEIFGCGKACSLSAIQDEVIKVYVNNELSMNTATMAGYALTYAVAKKVVPYSAVKNAMNKHLNII